MNVNFRVQNAKSLAAFLEEQAQGVDLQDTLKVDLHCHDYNSSEPDELWGRILRLPETWLKTETLLSTLAAQGCNPLTITNHNNAKSCWQQIAQGRDILVGAEFTCTFPEWDLKVHVLVYGFTQAQETELLRLKKNIYKFAAYAHQQDLPTVLPHPLYFYQESNQPPVELLEKFALLFTRFEVLNGQRDNWQNLLAVRFVQGMSQEKILGWAKKHGLDPFDYNKDPFTKTFTGGSDDHIGVFAGASGTYLNVPNLAERRKTEPLSKLALEALRAGRTKPYGSLAEEEKLHLTLLDYFAQVARNIEDPGLLRLLLHRGETADKLACLALGNLMMELKRHKYTMRFFNTFHQSLFGKRPGFWIRQAVSRDYRPAMDWIDRLAKAKQQGQEAFLQSLHQVLPGLFGSLQQILVNRVKAHMKGPVDLEKLAQLSPEDLVLRFEVPSRLRSFLGGEPASGRNMTEVNLSGLFDQLSFPALAALVVAGSLLGSSRALFQNRSFLNQVAQGFPELAHPKRVLWLTDTFGEKNGVGQVLLACIEEVRRRGLPIDFLVCDGQLEPGPNLKVVRPVSEFDLPQFGGQKFRFPDLMEVHKLFKEGGYDRVLCSTELLMGPVALFLKEAFKVPAYFYMHTDWLDFAKRSLGLDQHGLDRIRRLLRALYSQFDGVFALNREHQAWLTSSLMEIDPQKVHLTAHWVEERFVAVPGARAKRFPQLDPQVPVLLFAGRLSKEKGVLDLPVIYQTLLAQYPQAQMVIAGVGPAQEELKAAMPKAQFLGWVENKELPELYSAASLLVLPSRFDTFGCVVLEALSCGLPVAAYDTKGPRDILSAGGGVLADSPLDLAQKILSLLAQPEGLKTLQAQALVRARDYQAEPIFDELLGHLGLPQTSGPAQPQELTLDLVS
ncbi:MAG: hypothetical protein A2600_12970 [Candidatus Lambdaproteobacteria bacterium RIFOXYD1_FULL_56_27]|uniref:Glycosyl transferase family 1 n=1 Tax=Candidatus Lambdaproteobacteria bacterium RIFOXYD2_FULL_56_26 TaxID=1817773 RepID=A0A1F6GTL3_9PROT|nr:MAG: hypothetical protein A2426_09050 [Candidatus Lambdaproteobacteria bacterium RIFOXYC1_FULL_56_13]OGH01424.1 MAG: hypothetical protein A2557_09555 [Candidatus Lambdaproteobacteria bacterium RIFOXYD2_FULL_56_26]OGH06520.1 MAG: hypothetical protein A2600_12970 [Candidatus Lambdaproteobacteria bacterium RIFOXYD1_FULL_56_27]